MVILYKLYSYSVSSLAVVQLLIQSLNYVWVTFSVITSSVLNFFHLSSKIGVREFVKEQQSILHLL